MVTCFVYFADMFLCYSICLFVLRHVQGSTDIFVYITNCILCSVSNKRVANLRPF